MNHLLTLEESIQTLETLSQYENIVLSYDSTSHKIAIETSDQVLLGYLRLPIQYSFTNGNLVEEYGFVIVLIQSGYAAVGYCIDDMIVEHKAITSYMVRKKQGKSQIKHLKTKGKSRAGSRVRLAETERFFEDINERLTFHFEDYPVEKIAMSCSKTLLPFLFQSDTPPPFEKKDTRILKVGMHVNKPNFEELQKVHQFLLKGEIQEVNQELKEFLPIP